MDNIYIHHSYHNLTLCLQFINEEGFFLISIVSTIFFSYPYSLILSSSMDISFKVFFLIFNKSTIDLSIEFINFTLIGFSIFSTISLNAFYASSAL